MSLWVDTRYDGNHGIARYAREVISRLTSPMHPLPVGGAPTSIRSVAQRGWRAPASDDLIYSPGFGSGLSAAPQLLTLHDLIHLENRGTSGRAQRLYYDALVRRQVRRTGHVLTVSDASARAIRSWLDDSEVVVHNAGNGCSPEFTPDGDGHPHDRPYLLMVLNAKEHKNPRTALRAAALLPDFDVLTVSGDGPELRSMAAEAGIAERFQVIHGVTDRDLARIYRSAHALIYPSLLEGFGLPALEALSCGTPVVYYQGCPSVHEIVGRPEWAVADPFDHRAFADRVLAVERGSAAPRHPASWDDVARGVETAIRAAGG